MPHIPFKGLDVKSDPQQLNVEFASDTENTITVKGAVRKRLGRVEMGEEQLNPVKVLGVTSYRPIDSANEAIIVVTRTGIYRKQLS